MGRGGRGDVVAAPATHWMLAWLRGAIQRTTDGGTTGIQADAGIDKTGAAFVAPVRKCPVNDDVFLTGTNRMWRSNNFFSAASPSWAANGPPHPFPFPDWIEAPGTIHAIAFASSEGGCDTYAYGNRGGEIYLTRDGGATWTDWIPRRCSGPPDQQHRVRSHDRSIAYAALSSFDNGTPGRPGHVFKSTNALSATPTWIDISPAADAPFNVLAIDPRNPNLVYAGSDSGLWQTATAGRPGTSRGWRSGSRTCRSTTYRSIPDRQHHRVHLRARRVSAGDRSHHGARLPRTCGCNRFSAAP